MKISVLIPTRNRLDLLKYALTSVLKQSYQNWEIVISDNASTEDIGGYVKSLKDSRILYSRSEESLSITENWNRTVNLCSGDYIIMIGDDDIFLQNHFEIAVKLIKKFNHPELIYTNAFLYAYPGVIPAFPQGLFQTFGSLHGMPKHDHPFLLEAADRRAIIQETLKFNSIYSTNMQHALISRSLLERVKRNGQFFHSPYPDIYAMSALFLEADRIVIYPKELVVIGISSKSHGCYAINKKDDDAIKFLNIKNEMKEISSLDSVLLPGFVVFTFWLGAIELFKLNFSLEKLGLQLDYQIYRKLQINHVLNLYSENKTNFQKHLIELAKHLSYKEKLLYIYPTIYKPHIKKIVPSLLRKALRAALNAGKKSDSSVSESSQSSYTPLNPPPGFLIPNSELNKYSTILDIFDQKKAVDCI